MRSYRAVLSKPVPTGHDLDICRCNACRNFLGNTLEWITGQALERLRELGVVYEFGWIPERLEKLKRVDDYPDWWVKLVNGIEVELECKNWTARRKDYVKPDQTVHWLYKPETVHATTVAKRWKAGAKKVLVITTLELHSDRGRRARAFFDYVLETWRVAVDPEDSAILQRLVEGLFGAFRKVSGV